MMINSKYFSEKDTPLAYYKLLRVLVIFWLLSSAGRLFLFLSEDNMFGMLEMVILLIIQLFVVIGLYKKQWSGVVALYCMYAFNILDVLVALGIYVYYDIADASVFGETIGAIIGILIWAIPTWIYFSKRRPLFAPYKENTEDVYQTRESTYVAGTVQQEKYCSECGEKLINDSKFCYKCGKEVVQVVEQKNRHEKYQVCIFDASIGNLRKEMMDVDVIKIPPHKFATNSTYYAIETIRDNKKVRIYYEKNNWDKQIEKSL